MTGVDCRLICPVRIGGVKYIVDRARVARLDLPEKVAPSRNVLSGGRFPSDTSSVLRERERSIALGVHMPRRDTIICELVNDVCYFAAFHKG